MELIIRRPRLMLTYPAHFHNHIIPKVGLSARGHYTFKQELSEDNEAHLMGA